MHTHKRERVNTHPSLCMKRSMRSGKRPMNPCACLTSSDLFTTSCEKELSVARKFSYTTCKRVAEHMIHA